MINLEISRLGTNNILLEMDGTNEEIGIMLCEAMIQNQDMAAIVLGAIPSFLDQKKFDRAAYCKTVMNAKGSK